MKKKTNLQIEPEGDGAKPRKRGPEAEKTQVTLRLDKDLMNEAYKQMKEDNTRITDVIERGLVLALRERDHDMSRYTKQVRFVLANATRQQQAVLRGVAVALVLPDVLQEHKEPLPPLDTKTLELCWWYMLALNQHPRTEECLARYSRYGKSAEEIAALGSL